MAKRLSKSIVQTVLTQVPTQLFGIISGIFITRILTTGDRGVYTVLMANISLFLTFFGFSITTAIIYFLASNKLKIKQILGLSTLTFFILLFLSFALIISLYYSNVIHFLFLDAFSKEVALWFFFYLSMVYINSVFTGIFQSQKEFGVVNQVAFFNSLFNVIVYGAALSLYYLEMHTIGLNEILLISAVILIVNFFQWNYHFIKRYSYEVSFKINYKVHLRDLSHYLGLGHLSNVLNFLNSRIVLWILAFYLDNYQIGIFSIAFGLSQLLSFISIPLSQVLMPYLTGETKEERNRLFIIFSKLHFMMVGLMAIIGIIVSPYLIPFLYGSQYAGSILPFYIMIIGFVFSNQTRIMATYMFSSNRVVISLYATIIGFFSTIFFYFILIKKYGIIGASISTTLTYTVIFIFIYIVLIKSLKKEEKNFLILTKTDIQLLRNKIKF